MSFGDATGLTSRYFCKPGTFTLLIYNSVKARWYVESRNTEELELYVEIGSSQNDYAPAGFRGITTLKLVPTAANLTISGFGATNIYAPATRTIVNEGVYRIAILHMNTGSTAANRVACPGGTMYYLNPRESVKLYRDTAEQWYIAEKADQWIDVTYDAGNFTTDAGTWTVDGADQVTYCYHIDGNKMTVSFEIHQTDVGAGPTQLRIAVPAGRVIARTTRNVMQYIDAGAAAAFGVVVAPAGTTYLQCFNAAIGAWTNTAADNTYVLGQITFMVETSCATVSEAHSDTAHGDTAHADGGHSDTAHTDVAYIDSHSDTAHSDVGHGDVAHSDTHDDVAHSDVAHEDVAHEDGHSDSHDDVAHGDAHGDNPYGDGHGDFTDGVAHDDDHLDMFGDVNTHTDTAHGDSHDDTAHSDVAHEDVAHSDSHTDTHSDVAHVDSSHTDVAFSDSHSDTPHSDVAHVDSAHTDTVHADTPHTDIGLHCDTAHADV
jgi:hypothetical protein